MDAQAQRIVARFDMQPHPEGGYFREIYRSGIEVRGKTSTRRSSTLIYFLLAGDEFSAFHRVHGADEVWHLYAGGPLELHVIGTDGAHERRLLTTDLTDAEPADGEPTGVVPADALQAARLAPGARFAFCGCTVAPGFEFEDFEMPTREVLIAEHPEHAAIIEALTR